MRPTLSKRIEFINKTIEFGKVLRWGRFPGPTIVTDWRGRLDRGTTEMPIGDRARQRVGRPAIGLPVEAEIGQGQPGAGRGVGPIRTTPRPHGSGEVPDPVGLKSAIAGKPVEAGTRAFGGDAGQ